MRKTRLFPQLQLFPETTQLAMAEALQFSGFTLENGVRKNR